MALSTIAWDAGDTEEASISKPPSPYERASGMYPVPVSP
jgi:hypothetical protein